jgi:hypothetical protein
VRYATPVVLILGAIAGIVAIAVSVAIGVVQNFDQAKREDNVRQMLRRLLFSIPLGENERDIFRQLVFAEASQQGYDLRKVSAIAEQGGWISAAMYFSHEGGLFSDVEDATGLIVVSPEDYSDFASAPEDDARKAIHLLLFASLLEAPFDDALERIAHSAKILVLVGGREADHDVRIYRNVDRDTAMVVVGSTVVVADRQQIQDLIGLPGIARDLRIMNLIHENAALVPPQS